MVARRLLVVFLFGAALAVLPTATAAGPIAAWWEGDHLWVENDFYKWDVSKGSQFIVKVGSGPRDWRSYYTTVPGCYHNFLEIGWDDGHRCHWSSGCFGHNGEVLSQTPDQVVLRFRDEALEHPSETGEHPVVTTLTFRADGPTLG